MYFINWNYKIKITFEISEIFVVYLDPASARLSVLHANIKESRAASKPTPQSSPRLPRVFAISSLENNVIYHITNSKPECPLPREVYISLKFFYKRQIFYKFWNIFFCKEQKQLFSQNLMKKFNWV